MEVKQTLLGRFHIGSQEAIFRAMLGMIEGKCQQIQSRLVRLGLSGGSTPQAFYRWIVANGERAYPWLESVLWMVSDERFVPLVSSDSNFGTLNRLLLEPLKIKDIFKRPWIIEGEPVKAADLFNTRWMQDFGEEGFDICFLGMGDDAHTASLFPDCSLIGQKNLPAFAAVEWPGRGWRLTITEKGLESATSIVILASGEKKMKLIDHILSVPFNPHLYPIHILQPFAEKVTWLFSL